MLYLTLEVVNFGFQAINVNPKCVKNIKNIHKIIIKSMIF